FAGQIPKNADPSFLYAILSGLHTSGVSGEVKLNAARCAFLSTDADCLKVSLELLGTVNDVHLPADATDFIAKTAKADSESGDEPATVDGVGAESEILTHGINTVRGHAIECIARLIEADQSYVGCFSDVLEVLMSDRSISMRACTVGTLLSIAVHNEALALSMFERLIDADDRLLETQYTTQFVSASLRRHMVEMRPAIVRMLESAHEGVQKTGGRLACLARLEHVSEEVLSQVALAGSIASRRGGAEVAGANLLNPECREWCLSVLPTLFIDADSEVRRTATNCFWYLWQNPQEPIEQYAELIRRFLESPAFTDEPTLLLYALEETKQQVPEITIDVCEQFVTRCAEHAR